MIRASLLLAAVSAQAGAKPGHAVVNACLNTGSESPRVRFPESARAVPDRAQCARQGSVLYLWQDRGERKIGGERWR